MSFEIQNKTALVTGANRGIGRAIVDSLFAAGASKVYLAVRNLDSAQSLVEVYAEKVVPVFIDLGKSESITDAAAKATDVQLVINNAGVLNNAKPLAENAIKCLRSEMEINVIGLIRMAQAFAPILKTNGGGAFVQLNSVVSVKTFAEISTYSASKAAAYAITQGLYEQFAEQGTQLLSVHPGPIDTDMANNAGFGENAESPSVVSEGIIKALKDGEFHLFPDAMAKQIEEQYRSFATNVVETRLMET